MSLYRNVAGQMAVVYASDSSGPKLGDAANISLYISKDAGVPQLASTPSPTEIGGGYYALTFSQNESNASIVVFYGSSTTSGVKVQGGKEYTVDPISPISGTISTSSISTFSFCGNSGLQQIDQFYQGMCLVFTSGLLAGVARRITAYAGLTRTFTFAKPWPATASPGDSFAIVGLIDLP
jgi:hypothetical protein